jgi:PPK2 family polyphosphate:nucleotide phosphotransferase
LKIDPNDFRPRAGKTVDLAGLPTKVPPYFESKGHYAALLQEHIEGLRARQQVLYASGRHAVLLILQGMDSAGKDGTIAHIMSGVDPQGCEVSSFQTPSAEELEHDFLWRATCRLPRRGHIGIFNRSYYEEVLIVRIHPEMLARENLPAQVGTGKRFWKERYRSIVDLERHLHTNATRIIKVFLHLSKEEQARRFIARISDPHKNWKFSAADIHERKYWNDYVHAYAQALSATNTRDAPWYVVPADDKENSRLIVSKILIDTLDDLKLSYPVPTRQHRRQLSIIGRRLERE